MSRCHGKLDQLVSSLVWLQVVELNDGRWRLLAEVLPSTQAATSWS